MLRRLLEKLQSIRDDLDAAAVFNVVGEILPAAHIERVLREYYEGKQICQKKGLSLPFDIVRRFAQPLGIHLPDWEDRIIKTEKGVVKLIPVKDRAKQIFGENISTRTSLFEEEVQKNPQMKFKFAIEGQTNLKTVKKGNRHKLKFRSEEFECRSDVTTLDRIHAAMILQANGKTNALRTLLKSELDRGSEFLRLASALTRLYPHNSEEKRL